MQNDNKRINSADSTTIPPHVTTEHNATSVASQPLREYTVRVCCTVQVCTVLYVLTVRIERSALRPTNPPTNRTTTHLLVVTHVAVILKCFAVIVCSCKNVVLTKPVLRLIKLSTFCSNTFPLNHPNFSRNIRTSSNVLEKTLAEAESSSSALKSVLISSSVNSAAVYPVASSAAAWLPAEEPVKPPQRRRQHRAHVSITRMAAGFHPRENPVGRRADCR